MSHVSWEEGWRRPEPHFRPLSNFIFSPSSPISSLSRLLMFTSAPIIQLFRSRNLRSIQSSLYPLHHHHWNICTISSPSKSSTVFITPTPSQSPNHHIIIHHYQRDKCHYLSYIFTLSHTVQWSQYGHWKMISKGKQIAFSEYTDIHFNSLCWLLIILFLTLQQKTE